MKSVLFVDDEKALLDSIKRRYTLEKPSWSVHFINDSTQAMTYLENNPVDLIVSDILMPGVNGISLLTKVWERFPKIYRVALSGEVRGKHVQEVLSVVDRFLTKPCEYGHMVKIIEELFNIDNPFLNHQYSHQILSKTSLPINPEILGTLKKCLFFPEVSLQEICELIDKDPVLSAKIIQLANSAFFGTSVKVYNTLEAVKKLGLSFLSQYIIICKSFEEAKNNKVIYHYFQSLWKSSFDLAQKAKIFSKKLNSTEEESTKAYFSGLFYKFGSLFLAQIFSEDYTNIIKSSVNSQIDYFNEERKNFNLSYPKVGSYLLSRWGIDPIVTQAIYDQNDLLTSKNPESLCLKCLVMAKTTSQYYKGEKNQEALNYLETFKLLSKIQKELNPISEN